MVTSEQWGKALDKLAVSAKDIKNACAWMGNFVKYLEQQHETNKEPGNSIYSCSEVLSSYILFLQLTHQNLNALVLDSMREQVNNSQKELESVGDALRPLLDPTSYQPEPNNVNSCYGEAYDACQKPVKWGDYEIPPIKWHTPELQEVRFDKRLGYVPAARDYLVQQVKEAVDLVNKLPPIDRAIMSLQQRRSLGLSLRSFDSYFSREQALARLNETTPEFVVLEAYLELRKEVESMREEVKSMRAQIETFSSNG